MRHNKYYFTYKVVDKYWVYDRYSNNILEISETQYNILQDMHENNYDFTKYMINKKDHVGRSANDDIVKSFEAIINDSDKYDVLKMVDVKECVTEITGIDMDKYYSPTSPIDYAIVNITEDCNLRCKYCIFGETYTRSRKHSSKTMSYSTIDALVKMLSSRSTKKDFGIGFYGGEPLLEMDKIKYIVKKISESHIKCQFNLTTNGVLLTDSVVSYLVENKFKINISVDGPSTVHDKYRKTKKNKCTHHIIMDNIKKIKSRYKEYYDSNVFYLATLTKNTNISEVYDFFISNDEFPRILRYGLIQDDVTTFYERYEPEEEQKSSEVNIKAEYKNYVYDCIMNQRESAKYGHLRAQMFNAKMKIIDERSKEPLKEPKLIISGACTPGIKRVFVSSDGTLKICERGMESYSIGNLVDGYNKEAISALIERYNKFLTSSCKECWAARLCSICFIEVFDDYGNIDYKKEEQRCKDRRDNILNYLIGYTAICETAPAEFKF